MLVEDHGARPLPSHSPTILVGRNRTYELFFSFPSLTAFYTRIAHCDTINVVEAQEVDVL